MKKACFESRLSTAWKVVLLLLFSTASPAFGNSLKATPAELQQLIEQGVPVIDVRTPEEWRATGVIPESHLMTFFDRNGNYDVYAWLSKLNEVATADKPLAIICDVGNRSKVISTFLADRLGYSQVYDAVGGIRAWTSLSQPTRKWP